MIERNKYIFILSHRYSGSTLLSFLLATNHCVATIGERRKFFTKAFLGESENPQICSCRKKFEECPFWKELKSRLSKKQDESKESPNPTEFKFVKNRFLDEIIRKLYLFFTVNKINTRFLPYSNRMQKMLDFNEQLVTEVLGIENKTVFLDSSKSIKQLIFLSRIKSFDYRIVFLTRDPRAQVYSYLKYNNATISQAAKGWVEELETNLAVLKKTNLPYLKISYEALCKDPSKEMKRILTFSELDTTDFSLQFRDYSQHIMGNGKMRLGKDEKIDERLEWQTNFDKEQIKEIEKITEAHQGYYGTV